MRPCGGGAAGNAPAALAPRCGMRVWEEEDPCVSYAVSGL